MTSLKEARVQSTYEKPCAKKLKRNEAKQFLLRHAKLGDSGAKELLALLARQENSGD